MSAPESAISMYPPEPEEDQVRFEREVPALVDRAKSIVVHDQVGLTAANDISIVLTKTLREIDQTFDPIIEHFYKGHKMSLATKSKYADPIKAALQVIKNDKIGGYLAEQRRKEQEVREAAWRAEQDKIRLQQETLRKAQEAERKAAEEKAKAEAETRRLAAEADAKAARARSEEGRRKAQDEADRIRREAAERQKDLDALRKQREDYLRLEESRRQAELDAAIPAPIEKSKTDGISIREDWDFEVVEAKLIPREFLMVDEVKLRKYAKTMKGDADVSGVRFFSKTITTQRIK